MNRLGQESSPYLLRHKDNPVHWYPWGPEALQAAQTQNKYLGVLVAAKFARFVNEFPRDRSVDFEEKLTTRAFDELVRGRLTYKLVRRRRQEG